MMDIDKLLNELTLEEKASLCSGLDFWHTQPVERLDIPAVMMCDGPHGLRKQTGKTDMLGINASEPAVCYPSASALAASFDREILALLGERLAEICQAENVGMLLGPGLNMKRSPLCGRNFEYFSEDPYLAGELGAAYVKSLQVNGIAACVKHFACNNQETRRMSGSSEVDERTLHELYLPAFEKVVREAKPRGVMCAYNAVNGTFCAENKMLLTDILRKKWGYNGFVVTDWGAVKDRVKGLLAGLDLEMPGGTCFQDQKIVAAVKEGTLPVETLDAAVRNVLTFVRDYQEQHRDVPPLDYQREHDISVRIALECAVLLKNDHGMLPLPKEKSVAFVGSFVKNVRYQGVGSSFVNAPNVKSAMETVTEMSVPVRCIPSFDNAAENLAKSADIAVIFAGLPDAYEAEGADRISMEMPEEQNQFIARVAASQPNTVVVLHAGAPVRMPWKDQVSAILNMYLSGEGCGEAAVQLLYGEVNPSGHLAETYPLRLQDNPSYLNFPGEDGVVHYDEKLFIGYRYYDKKEMPVAFPFGHGLSYTSFQYRDLQMSRSSLLDTDTLEVRCMVRNTGNRAGKEAVQLYTGKPESEVIRPVRQLKGFEKIYLLPGEEKQVSFTLDASAFSYYSPLIHDFYVEDGIYTIEIGASSRDIRLAGNVEVSATHELPVHVTLFSIVGQLMKHKKGYDFIYSKLPQEKIEGGRVKTMPIVSLISYGVATEEEVLDILAQIQEDQLCGTAQCG